MPFQPVQSDKLALAVVDQIELLVLRGILRPGERLPSERDLAERMAVSRPSLREAVGLLQDRGLLTSKPGSGIFVSEDIGAHYPEALTQLFASHDDALFDFLAFRRDIEGIAAERAAKYASETDLKVVQAVFDKMKAAHDKRDPKEESDLDAEFHMAIVEASHNVVLLHMMRGMFELLSKGVFFNRSTIFKQRVNREALLEQHQAINDALQNRDGEASRAALENHLSFVSACLETQKKADKNEEIARLRYEHAQKSR